MNMNQKIVPLKKKGMKYQLNKWIKAWIESRTIRLSSIQRYSCSKMSLSRN